jgi:hypothetical protein
VSRFTQAIEPQRTKTSTLHKIGAEWPALPKPISRAMLVLIG